LTLNQEKLATLDNWGVIHQLLSIILKSRILVVLPVSTLSKVAKVKNDYFIGK
jgi:hypothetical protein